MPKNMVVDVVKHFPDGTTEVVKAALVNDNIPGARHVKQASFQVDGEWYFWPSGTKKGTDVEYKPSPSIHGYHRMTAQAQ